MIMVASYCRVSTETDEQATSYEAQIEHYTEYIKKNPTWEFAGIYAAVMDSSRSVSVSDMKTAFEDAKDELGIIGLPIKYYSDVRDAVTDIITMRKSGDIVFAAGSLYLIGEIKSFV